MKPFILTTQDRNSLRKSVLTNLCHGRHSAIKGGDLARRLGQSNDRKIRLVIRELIAEGVPIASSVTEPMGFYIVNNEHEAAQYIRVLKERIKEDGARLDDFLRAVDEYSLPEQLTFIGVNRENPS